MRLRTTTAMLLLALLGGCATASPPVPRTPPTTVQTTASWRELVSLPAPEQPIVVAVYDFPDLTGQYKPTETVTSYSRAVTQGALWILVHALKEAGGGRWFRVIERRDLEHLLKERQIIREMQQRYGGAEGLVLPPLLYAGLIVEGGIVGFDSNTLTGGAGARYLGIGGDVEYRQDTVTVTLAAVSSKTGEVLHTVTARKTIASIAVSASLFKFVSFKELLEAEAGFTANEPAFVAVEQAIQHAIRALVLEGAEKGLWRFADAEAGREALVRYRAETGRPAIVAAGAPVEAEVGGATGPSPQS